MSNQTILLDLDRWAQQEVRLLPEVSACRYFSECSDGEGLDCSMSYVGRRYGEGDGFRLVIVGMDQRNREVQQRQTVTLEERRGRIEQVYQQGNSDHFNPHYRGVAKTAAAVLGSEGAYCAEHCHGMCQKSRESSAPCVLDRIAQPNVVKCVFSKVNGPTSEATGTMWANCANHLVSELRILRPQLAVFHGAKAVRPVLDAIRAAYETVTPISDVTNDRGLPILYEWAASGTYLLFLHHPAHGALARQWPIAEKAFAFLTKNKLVPE